VLAREEVPLQKPNRHTPKHVSGNLRRKMRAVQKGEKSKLIKERNRKARTKRLDHIERLLVLGGISFSLPSFLGLYAVFLFRVFK